MIDQQHNRHEAVAITGMGCRWPGGAHDASSFWKFLCNKVDGWKEFEYPRFSAQGFHHPNPDRPGSFAMKGAFLAQEDARLFDHSFFGMTALEVETMDPSQRKLLEVAYEAIENAGETWESISGTRTGVFIGNFCLDHWMIQSRDWDNPRPYAFVGAGTSILANRISYIFNLQGPSLTIDTACSSSMYALHLAMNAIRAGDCDSAIVASANWIGDPGVQIALDKLGALSASSRCHTFDARAEGYARGEGYGAIYLKRQSLAVADGSPIRAMIRGSAVNSNGRTGGITRPSAKGQEAVIREAYRNAGNLPYNDTGYFECHGTGTYVGDPIEMAAVGTVFAQDRSDDDLLLVGSVKSNVGHGEGASALASIMKVVLALENGAIPPIYNLQTRNPNIDFEGAKVHPVTEVTPWPKDRLRRASINSFGYGGANAHCILDHVNNVLPDYVSPGVYQKRVNGMTNGHQNGTKTGHRPIVQRPASAAASDAATRRFVLLPVSGHNENSLKLNVDALSKVIDKFPLADVAYTLGCRRSRLAQRSFCIVEKGKAAADMLLGDKPLRAPLHTANLGFIFTGQGAQWHGMGAELLDYHVFQIAIEHLDSVLGSLPTPPAWSLYNILSGDSDSSLVQTALISQAVCTAVQIGLVDVLASWSVRPSGVAGHSSGEIAAAYASGCITAAEAIVAAYLRGQAVSRNEKNGSMLAVGLGPDEVAEYMQGLEGGVTVAAINSPGSVTLSGDDDAIDQISATMIARSIFNRKLKTGGNAYHSHHMVPIGRDYAEMLAEGMECAQKLESETDRLRYKSTLWVSSVSPGKSTAHIDDLTSYWRSNLEAPVRFSEAVTTLIENEDVPIHALVEIGPHSALKSPIQQIVKASGKNVAYAASLIRGQDSQKSMLQLAGTLFSLNANIDLVAVNAVDDTEHAGVVHGCTCSGLPPYQYTYGSLNYHESRPSKEYRHRSSLRHDLLGSKVVGTARFRPQWRNILRIKDIPWLGHHRLVPDAVMPGAGYLAMAVEAASRVHGELFGIQNIEGFSLADVTIAKSLTIPEDDYGLEVVTSMELESTATVQSSAWATFSISSVKGETDEWVEHCTGRVRVTIETIDDEYDTPKTNVSHPVSTRAWYSKFAEIGLGYGPVFQPLSNINIDANVRIPGLNTASAKLDLDSARSYVKGGESRYALPPAALDGAIQLGLIACYGGRPSEAHTAFVPVSLSHMYLSNKIKESAGDSCTVVARGQQRGVRGANMDLYLLNAQGMVIVNVDGLRCISYSSAARSVDRSFSSPFTRLVWKPDIRMLSNSQAGRLFPPPLVNVEQAPFWTIMNKLAHFIVLSIYESLVKPPHGPEPSGEMNSFMNWIRRKAENDQSEFMNEARALVNRSMLLRGIEELVNQAAHVPEVKIAKLLHDNMADILYQRRTGMDVIISEGLLTTLYQEGLLMTGIYPQLQNVLEGLAYSNPNARILEIGGGTGGATRIAMKAMNGPNGIKAYHDYTFTDISAGFLSGAREAMAHLRDMNFSVFDIEGDPVEQGYEEQAYDLIIACQVLHATSNMRRTLTNCRRLLKPGGNLVMVETTENLIVPGVVVGTFTGYWAGIPDGRVDAPFQSLPDWDRSLQEAGFSGLDAVLDDFPEPQKTTSVILSTVPFTKVSYPSTIHILHSNEFAPPLVEQITGVLRERGIAFKVGVLDDAKDTISPNSYVVALIGKEHLLINASERDLATIQHISQNSTRLVFLTSCGTVKGRCADGAVISGLLRVLANENPVTDYISIDMDADDFVVEQDDGRELARCIVDYQFELHETDMSEILEGAMEDREFSWQDGCMWISRHVPDAGFHSEHGVESRNMKPQLSPLNPQDAIRATFESPGVLNSLCFSPYKELSAPLEPGFIDVAVAAVGLNARDIDQWAGRLDADHLSSEYSGTVTAVGSQVNDFKIGDRVYGLGKGQFGNRTRVPAALAVKLQSSDNFHDMATMPMAYATAIYVLDYVVRLRKDQSVFIQSGAQNIGLALVVLSIAKGANVFATVDGEEQANLLVDVIGVPTTHIIASTPNLKSLRRIAHLAPKGGFDVMVSTTGDDILDPSMQVLAPLGHVIDIDHAALRSNPAITSGLFSKNISYRSVDILAILDSDPMLVAELMQKVDQYYRESQIRPLKGFPVRSISECIPAVGDFPNIMGKLVIDFEKPNTLIRMIPSGPSVTFDPDSSYVITGGLGGLGQSLIQWMGDRGARNISILSRRDVTSVAGAQEFIESLAARLIQIDCLVCDISNKDQVMRVIRDISTERPIRGIVHAAVSYLDLTFEKVTGLRWYNGLSAKVMGTTNLHEATLSMPLDFFVMTTSALSVYAFPTQGAYTAANNFQDAFARYRRQLGLLASTVSMSLVQGASNVGANEATVNLFERNGAQLVDESQFLTLFEPAFLDNRTAIHAGLNQWLGRQVDPLSAANLHTYLDPVGMLASKQKDLGSPANTPRWHNDNRVCHIIRALSDAQQQSAHLEESLDKGGKGTAASIRKVYDAAIQRGGAERTSTVALVQDAITKAVADMLFVDVESIDPGKSVADLGVDSLIAAELRNWFLQALGYNISMLDLLDPTTSICVQAASITSKALDASV